MIEWIKLGGALPVRYIKCICGEMVGSLRPARVSIADNANAMD